MKRSSPDSCSNQSAPASRDESPAPTGGGGGGKRARLCTFEPVRLQSVQGVADLEQKTLAVAYKKMCERLRISLRLERELRKRLETLESRQMQDEAVLAIVNRYWNRLDEDVRLLLQRFDAETSVESELLKESEPVKNFVSLLSQWDDEEIDSNLSQRVEFSRRAIGKLVQAFDRIMQRNKKVVEAVASIKGEATEAQEKKPSNDADDADSLLKTEKTEPGVKSEPNAEAAPKMEKEEAVAFLSKDLIERNAQLERENRKLQSTIAKLQQKNHKLASEKTKLSDQIDNFETKSEEAVNRLKDKEFELDKSIMREEKLDYRLAEVAKQLENALLEAASAKAAASCAAAGGASTGGGASAGGEADAVAAVSKSKLDSLQADLEEQRELAAGRLQEIRTLVEQKQKLAVEIDSLSAQLRHVPDEQVRAAPVCKSLAAQFAVLLQESKRMHTRLIETEDVLVKVRAEHAAQINQMAQDEMVAQKKLRAEILELQQKFSVTRNEYEMLRLEFEQTLAANEQTGPQQKEIRTLMAGYKQHAEHMKQEVKRYRRKFNEAVNSIAKLQKELDQEKKIRENSITIELSKAEAEAINSGQTSGDAEKEGESTAASSSTAKSTAASAAAAAENDRLRAELARLHAMERREKHKYYADDALKRIRYLEEQNDKLKKDVHNAKQTNDVYLSELESTGQALDDQLEQNKRLIQQLREKDDANLKLMSERIQSNHQIKKAKEMQTLLSDQNAALTTQNDAQQVVIRELEAESLARHTAAGLLDRQAVILQRNADDARKKGLESAQTAADLKLGVEKLTAQFDETSAALANKTKSLVEEQHKRNRLEEDLRMLRKQLERAKRLEQVGTNDEVFLEEIRELKEILTCASCKVNRKDAILTKCYHLFCFDCLTKRYNNRRRKCPKCQALFGAKDFTRVYLE